MTQIASRNLTKREYDVFRQHTRFLEDIACVALNQLPARYIKHDVNMSYFMTINEREKLDYDVHKAITPLSNMSCKIAVNEQSKTNTV